MFLLLSCAEPETTPTDTAQTDPVTCDTTIQETWPQAGAVDVYYRDTISFTLTEPDATAQVVADFEGVQSVSEDGLVVSYSPTDPLAPSTDYTVALDYCHGNAEIAFRTSAFGEPLDEGLDLNGYTWGFTLADAHSVEPAQVGELAANFFSNTLLLGVVDVDGETVDMRMAVATAGADTQDWCAQTFDIQGIALDGPYFDTSVRDISFDAYGTTFTLYDGQVWGTIAPDGTALAGARVGGLLDGVPIAETNLAGDIDALCAVVANLGGECVVCPSGDWGCFAFEMDRIEAVQVEAAVESIEDASADERCEPSD